MPDRNFAESTNGAAVAGPVHEGLPDQPIQCIDCDATFIWTSGEQAFYLEKNLLNPPKRCRDCKRAKNHRLAAIELAQATGRRTKIEVTAQCAECSVQTTVPFYPSQGRPVFCRACYAQQKTAEAAL